MNSCIAEVARAGCPASLGCLHAIGAMRCPLILLLHGCAADRQEVRAWLQTRKNASATEECTLEEACALTATLKRLHGPRVVLLADLEKAWPALFGEEFKDRHNHVPIIVLLHCFSSERREEQLRKYLTPHYLGKHRHIFASDRTDVSRGILGFPDDPGRGGVDFKTNGAKYISASRRVVVFSLHSNDSCPSHSHESGFFFEFEAVRCSAQVAGRVLAAAAAAFDKTSVCGPFGHVHHFESGRR